MARVSKPLQDNSLDIDLVRAALEADYVVLEELGRGGMAVVYRATEKALEREVAIKVLPSFMSMDGTFVDRFQHEARTAGQLEHPNIVPIYRVGRENRVIYFVMKLLRGQSLAAVLRERTKISVPEIRRILIETAAALGYAARRNVVHRDIKPDNILLDDEGRSVVTDFGIAKSAGGPLTAAGTSMGTPRYMSPEHARGIPLDGRSDMYSLGVVAYQCLTGTTPFDADDPFAILYKHINEPLPVPALATDEELAMFAVISKMLAKAPEERFQNADELIEALGGGSTTSGPTVVGSGGTLTLGSALQATLQASIQATQVAFAPTEIIRTPTFGTRLKQYSNDRRLWMGVAGASVAAMAFLAFRPEVSVSTSDVPNPVVGSSTGVRAAPPPGPGVGATVAASTVGATTRVVAAGATTGAKVGATTGAKAPPPARPPVTRIAPSAAALQRARSAAASKCPASSRADTTFAVLLDSVAPQKPEAKLPVGYDVCRLAEGAPFSVQFTLRKLNQGRFGKKQDPRTLQSAAIAAGPRSRHRFVMDLAGMSSGLYALDLIVRNAAGRDVGKTREFRLLDK